MNLGVSVAGTTQSLLEVWVTDKEVFQALNWTVDFPYMMGKVQSNLPGCAELGMALEEVMSNLFWKLISTHQAPGMKTSCAR